MKDYSNFLPENSYSCTVEGCSMKFTNEDHLAVHKKRHDMILNLGLGQKVTTFSDQTPTPTQFIKNCEEVGLFQDLQNVNPFEETFKKAVEAVKSGQLSLSFQASTPDDTLHTPKVFPHITDVPNENHSDACPRTENIPQCEEELLKQDVCDNNDKDDLKSLVSGQSVTQTVLSQTKPDNVVPLDNLNNTKITLTAENKVVLNVPEGHVVQLLPPEVFKNTAGDAFSPMTLSVKDKLKKNLNEKKSVKNIVHKVPILKCPVKRPSTSNGNKFAKFSKNAKKCISKLEFPEITEVSETTSVKQKKISKTQSKESRSEFLARSRAASSRCREKKKMYLLYLEKINGELSAANKNLILINSLLRQEVNDLRNELMKHRNCSVADAHTEASLTLASEANTMAETELSERVTSPEIIPPTSPVDPFVFKEESVEFDDIVPSEATTYHSDPSLFSFDVAEVILNGEPEESEIPLNEGNKPPDIIVRFNSVGNDYPSAIPSDSCLDRYIERAGENVKQIYGEHSYYLKKSVVDVDKRIMNYKTFRNDVETQISSEECKNLSALKIKIQQKDSLRNLTSLNSKVLLGPRTPPPLILLKPFKKRSLQNKRNFLNYL